VDRARHPPTYLPYKRSETVGRENSSYPQVSNTALYLLETDEHASGFTAIIYSNCELLLSPG
jgi:hypothetical protein